MSSVIKKIEHIEIELHKLKAEVMPEKIPDDEGFKKYSEEELNRFYEDLKNPELWGTEEELFKLLNDDDGE